ncbi:MAG: GNAT family N-acetyltransferase [Acholeplasma sp.]|nr:GNAT family N-acetyltransferase [Acholeplasma sp.]
MEISIIENGLTVEIYDKIRQTAGFLNYEKEDITYALSHSLYSVVVYDSARPVGIARIVGDNRIAFFIKDVVAIPEYQHKGIGKILMAYLFKYIDKHAAHNAYVGLMSTPGKEAFYKKFGFIERPTEGYGSGMVLFYDRKTK